MIGLASAAVGLGKSIFGGIKSARARRQQDRLLNEAQQRNDNMFNKEYYADYMQRSDAQAAMRRVRDTMLRNNRQATASAAITGATPEALAAQRAANNEAITNTAGAIQANADAHKANVRGQYLSQQQSLDNARMGQLQQTEQNYSKFADSGLNMMGKGISGSKTLGKLVDKIGG